MIENKWIKQGVQLVAMVTAAVMIQSCSTGGAGGVGEGNSPQVPSGSSRSERSAHAPSLTRKKAESRPGLATTQGRSISSKVSLVGFLRENPSRPKGVASIYYNDEEGVEAMTSTHWKYKGSKLQDAAGGLVEWGVRSGFRYAPNYYSNGKRFVVGKKGNEYAIVIHNKCHARLEVVLSVDGLNILSGKQASVKQRGYVIEAGKTLVVKGYRTGNTEVNAFKFSDVASSVSNQLHGKTKNVGVIGMAVFAEKGVSPWRWTPKVVGQRLEAKPF